LQKTASGTQYSSKIIKAGALLPDTKVLLGTWDETAGVQENLEQARASNVFGKTSRSRVEDILAIFRQRYFGNTDLLRALVTLAESNLSPEALDRILYFQAAASDPLLRDFVSEVVFEWSARPDPEVRLPEARHWLGKQVEAGHTEREWSENVQTRVVQGLLSTLRDFGVLEGQVKKRVAYPYLPTEAFAFTALQLRLGGASGGQILASPAWRVFLVPQTTVERFFLEAHQEGLLEYQAAGSVIRVDFPADNLEGYARVLAER
jgi:hypothetical protein